MHMDGYISLKRHFRFVSVFQNTLASYILDVTALSSKTYIYINFSSNCDYSYVDILLIYLSVLVE